MRRAVHAVADVVRECNYAQRRLFELRFLADLHAGDGDGPADTYAEFLFRCPAALWREPSARRRAAGARPGQ